MLAERLGTLDSSVVEQIEGLTLKQLDLWKKSTAESITSDGLIDWLEQQAENRTGE